MSSDALQLHRFKIGKSRNVAVDFTKHLDEGELLTGTPTVEEVTTSTLTISNKTVSTGALSINKKSVVAGRAVQCSIVGSVAGFYEIDVYCFTDSSPSQEPGGRIRVEVY